MVSKPYLQGLLGKALALSHRFLVVLQVQILVLRGTPPAQAAPSRPSGAGWFTSLTAGLIHHLQDQTLNAEQMLDGVGMKGRLTQWCPSH